jgi:hypothetical protein
MNWQRLELFPRGEADIQTYFEKWREGVPGWRAAGAPGWLAEMVPGDANKLIKSGIGYGFKPDLLGTSRGEEIVFEFKCAAKYEPLALGEVLHHAWMLSHGAELGGAAQRGVSRTPAIVTQYNSWLRAAFAFLIEQGLTRTAFKHVEFTTLTANQGAEILLWFDEPHAEWKQCNIPPVLPDGLCVEQADWYRVEDTETWIAVRKQTKIARRPPLWTSHYLMLTAISDSGEFLTWDGLPEETGRYLLWGPKGRQKKEVRIQMT